MIVCDDMLVCDDLFFDFKEALTSFKFENFDYILKFTFVDYVVEDLSPVSFTKVKPLIWEYEQMQTASKTEFQFTS